MKGIFVVLGAAVISVAGVGCAIAQTPTTTPQTGTGSPSARDASKTGSQTSAGANTKPGASGDSTMNHGGAPNAGKMKKDKMTK
jgi:hypothetical protein